MPPIIPGDALLIISRRDDGLMERMVARVLELGFRKAVVVVDGAVTDELDLRDGGDGL